MSCDNLLKDSGHLISSLGRSDVDDSTLRKWSTLFINNSHLVTL